VHAGGFAVFSGTAGRLFRYFKKFDILYGKAKKAML
jgi:hypothetical protein